MFLASVVASKAGATPKSLFVQATSVPTGADAYQTRTWFHKVCMAHRTPGSPDFIYNLVLSEIAETSGTLATAALDIIEDYYGCFDNVFVGTVNLPHADPYVSGMKDASFRWDNINLSVAVANAYQTRFSQKFPGQDFHWYVSYEANLNYLASDTALKNAYAAFLLELSNQLNVIRPGAVLWSPAFWTPFASVPNPTALRNALSDVFTTAPGITWLHFQDFVGQAARKNCNTGNVTYGFTAADGIGYFGLVNQANPGSLASVRVNMEHFILGDVTTCGTWYMEPSEPAELAAREAAYETANVPIGASWEIRWWYLAHYGPVGQECNQPEVCDGQDNNCNLLVDEGCPEPDAGVSDAGLGDAGGFDAAVHSDAVVGPDAEGYLDASDAATPDASPVPDDGGPKLPGAVSGCTCTQGSREGLGFVWWLAFIGILGFWLRRRRQA